MPDVGVIELCVELGHFTLMPLLIVSIDIKLLGNCLQINGESTTASVLSPST